MISGEMIVRVSVIIAAISWCADCYIEDLCPNCNLYQDSAEVSRRRNILGARCCFVPVFAVSMIYVGVFWRGTGELAKVNAC